MCNGAIIDQSVYRPVGLGYTFHRRVQFAGMRKVKRFKGDTPPRRSHDRLELGCEPSPGGDYPVAVGSQALRNAEPEPAGTAGHQHKGGVWGRGHERSSLPAGLVAIWSTHVTSAGTL